MKKDITYFIMSLLEDDKLVIDLSEKRIFDLLKIDGKVITIVKNNFDDELVFDTANIKLNYGDNPKFKEILDLALTIADLFKDCSVDIKISDLNSIHYSTDYNCSPSRLELYTSDILSINDNNKFRI